MDVMLVAQLCAWSSALTWAVASLIYRGFSDKLSAFSVLALRSVVITGVYLILLGAGVGFDFWPESFSSWLLPIPQMPQALGVVLALGVISFFQMILGDMFYLRSLDRLGVAPASALSATFPIVALVLESVVRGNSLSLAKGLGMGLTLAGVVGIILSRELTNKNAVKSSGIRRSWKDYIDSVWAILFWGCSIVALSEAAKGLPLIWANFFRYGMLAVFVGPLLLRNQARRQISSLTGRQWIWLLVAMLFDAGFGAMAYTFGVVHAGPAVASSLSSTYPLFLVPLAWLFHRDSLGSVATWVAMLLTLSGVVWTLSQ